MTTEEKAKRYDEALEKARQLCVYPTSKPFISDLQDLFPELAEPENEKIRESLLEYLHTLPNHYAHSGVCAPEWIAWLEKQGTHANFRNKIQIGDKVTRNEDGVLVNLSQLKRVAKKDEKQGVQKPVDVRTIGYWHVEDVEQKPANRVEPKIGDWIIYDRHISKVKDMDSEGYLVEDTYGDEGVLPKEFAGKHYHLWTIKDAKDGDVLSYVTDEEDLWIMIYWSLYEPYEGHVHYHALLVNDNFSDKGTCCICIDDLKLATKEQREQLEKAMADAGYTFDFEKKELKKIEQKSSWSEEDEVGLANAMWAIEQARTIAKDENDMGNLWYAERWLKSIRPQNTWKPSDEQMNNK